MESIVGPTISAMPLDKHHLNPAGEYRVAAELLKRGIFATITPEQPAPDDTR